MDIGGHRVDLTIERFDADQDTSLSQAMLSRLADLVDAQWRPIWDAVPGRDADSGWDWRKDVLVPSFRYLGKQDLVSGSLITIASTRDGADRLEGLCTLVYGYETFNLPPLIVPRPGRRPVRPKAVYVDALAVAPWNRRQIAGSPLRISGLGQELLVAAMLLSRERGSGGRLALHAASLAQSWYATILTGASFTFDRKELQGLLLEPTDVGGPYIEVGDNCVSAFLGARMQAATEWGALAR